MGLPDKELYGTAKAIRCKMYIQTREEYLKLGMIPCANCGCLMIANGWVDEDEWEYEDKPL